MSRGSRSKRVSIADHDAFLSSLLTEDDLDELSELVVDPLTERHAKPRKESETAKVLSILDELERSGE